ncbi:sugar ABC transporter substrate-binding protein, partial [Pseudomonas syringae pv. tagetis]
YDNINAFKPMLKDGSVLASADQYAARQAVFGIEAALMEVKGEKVDTNDKGVFVTPVELVTKP